MKTRYLFVIAAVAALTAAFTCLAYAGPEKHFAMNNFDFSYSKGGIALKYKGVTVIRRSSLYVVAPGWSRLLFGHHVATQNIASEDIPGGKLVKVAMENENFRATYNVTMLESDEIIIELVYELLQDTPAEIEYCLGYIPAPLIAGFPYEADTPHGHRSGTVPYIARSANHQEAMLESEFTRLRFDSRLADVELTVSGDQPNLLIFDARRDPQAWAREAPVFWCGLGVPAAAVKNGREYRVVSKIKFTPGRSETTHVIEPATVSATPVKDAKLPQEDLIKLIPEVKSAEFTRRDFTVSQDTVIVLPDNANSDDKLNAEILNEELGDIYGITLPVIPASEAESGRRIIAIGEPGRNSIVARLCRDSGIEPPAENEGYALKACSQFVVVAGRDMRGTFFGTQTLLQLLRPTVRGAAVNGAVVKDWPTMKTRGAHVFIGSESKPFLKKLIRRIFARHKMNYLIIQADYTKWETHPEIWLPWSTSKADLGEIIDYARLHHMEVVPLVQSLGHSEWMFANKTNINLAEDPDHPYGYCPLNPDSYKFIFDIYDEALDLFKPKVFHIGHDEVTFEGRYPNHPACREKGTTELFMGDIEKLHGYFSKKGVQVMMWGDMLLHKTETPDAGTADSPEDARARRERLPKDIAVADWHYCPADDFPSVRLFRDRGHQVLACTWYAPRNIEDFSRSAKRDKADGLIETLWSGYNISEKVLGSGFDQFTAYILAAEFGWNTGQSTLGDLTYVPAEEFTRLWKRAKADRTSKDGFTLDLSSIANTALSGDAGAWLGYGPEHDLRQFETGNVRLGGVSFAIPQNKAIMLSGRMNPDGAWPEGVRIPLSKNADSLAFLITTGWHAEKGTPVGRITVRYSPTESVVLDLVYGENVVAWNDPSATPSAIPVWAAKTSSGEKAVIRMIDWQNPWPDKPIQSVEITSQDTEATPVILAITALGAGEVDSK